MSLSSTRISSFFPILDLLLLKKNHMYTTDEQKIYNSNQLFFLIEKRKGNIRTSYTCSVLEVKSVWSLMQHVGLEKNQFHHLPQEIWKMALKTKQK